MQIRIKLEALVEEMLDGQILLEEALSEFERLYIERALSRQQRHLSRTADMLGIHRNTLAKRVASYHEHSRVAPPRAKRLSR
ncbi:MAG: helix-turn-helix domain-containing protein [Pyrinomonadaceae bacterium]